MCRQANLFFILLAVVLSTQIFSPAISFCDNGAANIIPNAEDIAAKGITSDTNTQKAIEASPDRMSLFDLIQKGGIVGYLIILLSVISLALIVDYAFTLREKNFLPQEDIKLLEELIKNPDQNKIERYEQGKMSFLFNVTIEGIKEAPHGYHTMIKAMEDTGEALASAIARKIEHLNVIGNIAPMMGLLGTVIGMLRCFNEIAHVSGAIEPKQLAGGIFEALITTCMGLIVAIPALYAYALFRNRVDEFTGKASLTAEKLVSDYKTNNKG